MIIQVTQYCIDRGDRGSGAFCPIALALRKNTNYGYASVDEINIALWNKGGAMKMIRTPEEAAIFIKRFDNGEQVEPFRFELEVE